MIQQRTLAEIIQRTVALGSANSRGFFDVRCAVCNDRKDRGGFKFDSVHTGYSCYNCHAAFKYEEGSGKFSKNARQILEAFGITREVLTEIRSAMLQPTKEQTEISLDDLKRVKLDTPTVALPDRSFSLGYDGHDEFQGPIIEYLLDRKIDPLAVKAHFSLEPAYLRRAIIPYFRDGKIIYWQARSIDSDAKRRYLNAMIGRDAVMYGYDRLFNYDPTPLFVTEGVFDAIVLGGVCILGSVLNAAKIEVLKKSRRRVIFVIDRDKAGGDLGQVVIENGWELSYVDRRADDANESVRMFGLPFTVYTLLKNATTKTDRDGSIIKLAMGQLEARLGVYR